MEISVIYEDDDILVVNKPSGLPTQGTVDKTRANLYDLLRNSGRWPYLALHHRLDSGTSGVVLLVKNKEYNFAVGEMFKKHGFEKIYHCLCHQIPEWEILKFQNHLKAKKFSGGKTKMLPATSGADFAETDFRVLQKFAKACLIEAKPLTGRMHQIRTHLCELRFPILGDALYFRADRKYPRLMLHAFQLKFLHPRTQLEVCIQAEYPEDFEKGLQRVTNAETNPSSN